MSKFERWYRLILLILMFATFWLPTGVGTYVPLWNTLLVVGGMALTCEIEPFFPIFPFMMGPPVLFLVNIWLLLRPSKVLRTFYRILVASVVAVHWYTMVSEGSFRLWFQVWGVLAEIMLISVSALFEVVFVVLGLLKREPHLK